MTDAAACYTYPYGSGADCVLVSLSLANMYIDKTQMNWTACQTNPNALNCNFTNAVILVHQNDTIVYKIFYQNLSTTETVDAFTIADVVPRGINITAQSSVPPLTYIPPLSNPSWTGVSLDPLESGYIILTGTLIDEQFREYRNTGIVYRDGLSTGDDVLALVPQVRIDKMQRNITQNNPPNG